MLFYLFFSQNLTHGIFSLYSLGTNGFAIIPEIFFINISAANSILSKILTKIWTRIACRNANEIITLTCDFLWSLGQVTNLSCQIRLPCLMDCVNWCVLGGGCALLAEFCPSHVFFFFSKLLGFSDTGEVNTGEVKCRNAHLSHYIWYCYAYVVTINTVAPYVFEQ